MAVGWTAYLLNQSATTESALAKPFAVAPELRAQSQSIESLTDHQQYQFVRLHADEVPPRREGRHLPGRSGERRGAHPARGRHRRRAAAGSAGASDGDRDRRPADAQAALGPDPDRRRDRLLHRAARVPRADLRGRRLPAARLDHAGLPRRTRARDLGQGLQAHARRRGRVRGHAVLLGRDRGRFDPRDPRGADLVLEGLRQGESASIPSSPSCSRSGIGAAMRGGSWCYS